MREAYARTIAACRKHGKHVGVGGLSSRPKLVAEFVKMGARYVSTGTDLAFLLGRGHRARQAGARTRLRPRLSGDGRAAGTAPQASSTPAPAADAFARSLLAAHGVPERTPPPSPAAWCSADLRGVDTHGLLPAADLSRPRARAA